MKRLLLLPWFVRRASAYACRADGVRCNGRNGPGLGKLGSATRHGSQQQTLELSAENPERE